ncbi:MAG: molybdopterin-dependent oxidoreductase [Nocardioides sp.]
MVRDSLDEEWRVVSWEEAVGRVAEGFRGLQDRYGVGAIGGISSSRCTNEEVYVVQKMVRAAFGNNNVDTCARVCHSPPAMASTRPSALRPARRTSSRSSRPTSCSSSGPPRPMHTPSSRPG